jgi:hypothetical protein
LRGGLRGVEADAAAGRRVRGRETASQRLGGGGKIPWRGDIRG